MILILYLPYLMSNTSLVHEMPITSSKSIAMSFQHMQETWQQNIFRFIAEQLAFDLAFYFFKGCLLSPPAFTIPTTLMDNKKSLKVALQEHPQQQKEHFLSSNSTSFGGHGTWKHPEAGTPTGSKKNHHARSDASGGKVARPPPGFFKVASDGHKNQHHPPHPQPR